MLSACGWPGKWIGTRNPKNSLEFWGETVKNGLAPRRSRMNNRLVKKASEQLDRIAVVRAKVTAAILPSSEREGIFQRLDELAAQMKSIIEQQKEKS